MEEWKPIKNYEETYQVSNLGRVRSLPKYYPNRKAGPKTVKGQILTPYNNRRYPTVGLSSGSPRKIKNFRIHTLVAMAFLDQNYRENNLVVNHLDGDKTNNFLSNLELTTTQENLKHAREVLNTNPKGLKAYASKIKDPEEISNIIKRVLAGERRIKIAMDYKVSRSTIDNIMKKSIYDI